MNLEIDLIDLSQKIFRELPKEPNTYGASFECIGLKDLFDVVTELDVKSYFKFTYGFTPNVLMCPDALPKSIVEPYCNELIEYMESRKTEKTQVYIDSLKNLIERKSFDEQWEGDDLKYGMRNSKENLLFLEKIRDQELTFREILNEPGKEWWDGI